MAVEDGGGAHVRPDAAEQRLGVARGEDHVGGPVAIDIPGWSSAPQPHEAQVDAPLVEPVGGDGHVGARHINRRRGGGVEPAREDVGLATPRGTGGGRREGERVPSRAGDVADERGAESEARVGRHRIGILKDERLDPAGTAVDPEPVGGIEQRQLTAAVDQVRAGPELAGRGVVGVIRPHHDVRQPIAREVARVELVGPGQVEMVVEAAFEPDSRNGPADRLSPDLDRASELLEEASVDQIHRAAVGDPVVIGAVERRADEQVGPAVAVDIPGRRDRDPELRPGLIAVEDDVRDLRAWVDSPPAVAVVDVDLAGVLDAVDVGVMIGDRQVVGAVAAEVADVDGGLAVVREVERDPVARALGVEHRVGARRPDDLRRRYRGQVSPLRWPGG